MPRVNSLLLPSISNTAVTCALQLIIIILSIRMRSNKRNNSGHKKELKK